MASYLGVGYCHRDHPQPASWCHTLPSEHVMAVPIPGHRSLRNQASSCATCWLPPPLSRQLSRQPGPAVCSDQRAPASTSTAHMVLGIGDNTKYEEVLGHIFLENGDRDSERYRYGLS